MPIRKATEVDLPDVLTIYNQVVATSNAVYTEVLALHAKLGFTEAGCLRQVARKFGKWLDLLFMQRMP